MRRSTGNFGQAKGYVRLVVGNLVVFVLMVLVAEGLSSYILLARLLARNTATSVNLAERRHTEFDPDLGWVNKPNVNIPDMYGRGVYLKTNSQRFRNNYDFDPVAPGGKQRAICSGDSFTLGYGVDNDHTWCQMLTSLDPRLETVNMGQGGYGIDQAYLWFKRDALRFEHRIHLFAFITADIYRMQANRFLTYGKPVIEVENELLVVRNVPVPKRDYDFPRLTSNLEYLRSLRTIELLERISGRVQSGQSGATPSAEKNARTRAALGKIFEDLKRLGDEHSSKLVLVYLPTLQEMKGNDPREWMQFVESKAGALGIPVINVFSAFRARPAESIAGMFISEGQIDYPAAAGHLNEKGNEFVARLIYNGLKDHLAIEHMPR